MIENVHVNCPWAMAMASDAGGRAALVPVTGSRTAASWVHDVSDPTFASDPDNLDMLARKLAIFYGPFRDVLGAKTEGRPLTADGKALWNVLVQHLLTEEAVLEEAALRQSDPRRDVERRRGSVGNGRSLGLDGGQHRPFDGEGRWGGRRRQRRSPMGDPSAHPSHDTMRAIVEARQPSMYKTRVSDALQLFNVDGALSGQMFDDWRAIEKGNGRDGGAGSGEDGEGKMVDAVLSAVLRKGVELWFNLIRSGCDGIDRCDAVTRLVASVIVLVVREDLQSAMYCEQALESKLRLSLFSQLFEPPPVTWPAQDAPLCFLSLYSPADPLCFSQGAMYALRPGVLNEWDAHCCAVRHASEMLCCLIEDGWRHAVAVFLLRLSYVYGVMNRSMKELAHLIVWGSEMPSMVDEGCLRLIGGIDTDKEEKRMDPSVVMNAVTAMISICRFYSLAIGIVEQTAIDYENGGCHISLKEEAFQGMKKDFFVSMWSVSCLFGAVTSVTGLSQYPYVDMAPLRVACLEFMASIYSDHSTTTALLGRAAGDIEGRLTRSKQNWLVASWRCVADIVLVADYGQQRHRNEDLLIAYFVAFQKSLACMSWRAVWVEEFAKLLPTIVLALLYLDGTQLYGGDTALGTEACGLGTENMLRFEVLKLFRLVLSVHPVVVTQCVVMLFAVTSVIALRAGAMLEQIEDVQLRERILNAWGCVATHSNSDQAYFIRPHIIAFDKRVAFESVGQFFEVFTDCSNGMGRLLCGVAACLEMVGICLNESCAGEGDWKLQHMSIKVGFLRNIDSKLAVVLHSFERFGSLVLFVMLMCMWLLRQRGCNEAAAANVTWLRSVLGIACRVYGSVGLPRGGGVHSETWVEGVRTLLTLQTPDDVCDMQCHIAALCVPRLPRKELLLRPELSSFLFQSCTVTLELVSLGVSDVTIIDQWGPTWARAAAVAALHHLPEQAEPTLKQLVRRLEECETISVVSGVITVLIHRIISRIGLFVAKQCEGSEKLRHLEGLVVKHVVGGLMDLPRATSSGLLVGGASIDHVGAPGGHFGGAGKASRELLYGSNGSIHGGNSSHSLNGSQVSLGDSWSALDDSWHGAAHMAGCLNVRLTGLVNVLSKLACPWDKAVTTVVLKLLYEMGLMMCNLQCCFGVVRIVLTFLCQVLTVVPPGVVRGISPPSQGPRPTGILLIDTVLGAVRNLFSILASSISHHGTARGICAIAPPACILSAISGPSNAISSNTSPVSSPAVSHTPPSSGGGTPVARSSAIGNHILRGADQLSSLVTILGARYLHDHGEVMAYFMLSLVDVVLDMRLTSEVIKPALLRLSDCILGRGPRVVHLLMQAMYESPILYANGEVQDEDTMAVTEGIGVDSFTPHPITPFVTWMRDDVSGDVHIGRASREGVPAACLLVARIAMVLVDIVGGVCESTVRDTARLAAGLARLTTCAMASVIALQVWKESSAIEDSNEWAMDDSRGESVDCCSDGAEQLLNEGIVTESSAEDDYYGNADQVLNGEGEDALRDTAVEAVVDAENLDQSDGDCDVHGWGATMDANASLEEEQAVMTSGVAEVKKGRQSSPYESSEIGMYIPLYEFVESALISCLDVSDTSPTQSASGDTMSNSAWIYRESSLKMYDHVNESVTRLLDQMWKWSEGVHVTCSPAFVESLLDDIHRASASALESL